MTAKRVKKPETKKVYGLRMTQESIGYALRQRVYRITPKYVLVFTENEPELPCILISNADAVGHFKDEDWKWLKDCIGTIAHEEAKRHENEIEKLTHDFLDEFERELKAEQEKENGRTETGETARI